MPRAQPKETSLPSAAERVLDEAIEFTFPASDPISIDHAFRAARSRDRSRAAESAAVPEPSEGDG